MLCLAYGVGNILYSGTLSGDVYKWKDNILVGSISGAHSSLTYPSVAENDLECLPTEMADGERYMKAKLYNTIERASRKASSPIESASTLPRIIGHLQSWTYVAENDLQRLPTEMADEEKVMTKNCFRRPWR